MPKKHYKAQFSKPASSVHPSLSSSFTLSKNAAGATQSSVSSVNELINHLRRSQAPSAADTSHDDLNTPTVHPSLRAIFQVPETPPPRPRPGMQLSRRLRGPPGPPPPRSWLTDSIHAPAGSFKKHESQRETRLEVPRRLDRLPGLRLPFEGTLLQLAFKELASNWHWHVAYDQHYLATLPIRYKEVLLSYIAVYNNHNNGGIGALGLETLFLDDTELEDSTGSDSLTHLDLACSISTVSSFKQLDNYMTKTITTADVTPLANDTYNDSVPDRDAEAVLDDWETEADASNTIAHSITQPRFPNLTHLSLSHPDSTPPASWRQLLALTPHLATLTHLSLAHWPVPCLTPNAITASTTSPRGKVDYGGSNFYSASDGDWKEAAGILRRLSKATYCLKWLDLEGCGSWIAALSWEDREGSLGSVEWNGGWRGVEVVQVGQGWIPECLENPGDNWQGVLRGHGKMGRMTDPPPSRLARFAITSPTTDTANAIRETFGDWDPDVERRNYALKHELMGWVLVEQEVAKVEAAVRKKRTGAGGKKVVFEKGWEGWWIEEAVKVQAKSGASSQVEIVL